MAYISDWMCIQCGKSYHSAAPRNHICHECTGNKKQAYLDKLKKLTIEERISKIEEWIYDNKFGSNSHYGDF